MALWDAASRFKPCAAQHHLSSTLQWPGHGWWLPCRLQEFHHPLKRLHCLKEAASNLFSACPIYPRFSTPASAGLICNVFFSAATSRCSENS